MIEVRTSDDLYGIISLPFYFRHGNDTYVQFEIKIENLISSTTYSEKVSYIGLPKEGKINGSILSISEYIDPVGAGLIKSMLKNIVQKSSLYLQTIHLLTLTFMQEDGKKVSVKRYFSINPLLPQTFDSFITMSMDMQFCDVNYSISEPTSLRLDTYVIAECTNSDICLTENVYTKQPKFLKQHVNICNHEMNAVTAFAILTNIDGTKKCIAQSTIAQQTIIIPSIIFTKNSTSVLEDGTKKIPCSVKINGTIFDGVEYKDYGGLFLRKGFSIGIVGTDKGSIEVNKKVA